MAYLAWAAETEMIDAPFYIRQQNTPVDRATAKKAVNASLVEELSSPAAETQPLVLIDRQSSR